MINWGDAKVLVAGGCGMIGSNMAKELVKRRAKVTIADNLLSGSLQNIKGIENDVVMLEWDLRNEKNCLRATEKMDYVFGFMANMGGIAYISEIGAEIMRDNFLLNINMIHASHINKVKRYFYSSSACIYPEYRQLSEEVEPLKESDAYPSQPDNFYGVEKIGTEKICEAYQRDYGMDIRIARFHNIMGEAYTAFDKVKGKAPCHMIVKALKYPQEDFVIWGDGKQTRSFLYIDDCIDGILQLMDSDYNKPVNIGSDKVVTINELANMAIKLSGKRIKPKHDMSKPQGVRGRNADLTLVKREIGWQPKVSLEEGMKRIYKWADKHFDELENI